MTVHGRLVDANGNMQCRKCLEFKPLLEYNATNKHNCKKCLNKQSLEYRKNPESKEKTRKHQSSPEYRERSNALRRIRRKKAREQRKQHLALANSVQVCKSEFNHSVSILVLNGHQCVSNS